MYIDNHDRHHHDDYHNHHHYHYHHSTRVSSPKSFIIIGICILLFMTLFTSILIFTTDIFKTDGYVETTGIIVDETCHFDYDNGDYMYSAIAEYEVNGEKLLVKSTSSSNIPVDIGKEVVIEYNIDNPRDARFKKDTMMVKFIGIPIIAVFYIIAIVMIVVGIKKSRKQESENLSI